MNTILFEKAKDGSQTCSYLGKYLHSKYNPIREAENFSNSLRIEQKTKYIVLTEPCISYSASFLKKKFNNAKLVAIRYSFDFENYNQDFDIVLYTTNQTQIENLFSELILKIGEKDILNSAFIPWISSSNVFFETDKKVWKEIKYTVEYCRSILFTNSFFSKRWFLNSIRNLIFTKNLYSLNNINPPIVIAASGKSLKTSIPFLKKYRDNFFLISVSSATLPLIKNKIIPNLVLSTDGGYWAKKHLEILKQYPNIPVALSVEGSCPFFILKNNPIILLKYADGTSSNLINQLDLQIRTCERNGTVSGTAAEFAINLTDKKIYICGLDLSNSKGFQHTMPNSLEILNEKSDTKICGVEKRSAQSELNSSSLKIYEKWFSSSKRNFYEKVFRLSDNYNFSNNLNSVKDVNFDFFLNDIKQNFMSKDYKKNIKNIDFFTKNKIDNERIANSIYNFLDENLTTDDWMNDFFPAEMFSIENTMNKNEKERKILELSEKNKKFIQKIKRLLDNDL